MQGSYNPMMRRSARFGLAVAILVVAGFGAYSIFWWIAAGRLAEGVAAWAQAAQGRKLAVSWQELRVAGYPFWFRVELSNAQFRDGALGPAAEVTAPRVWGSARPWNFRDWRLAAPDGVQAGFGPPDSRLASLAAHAAGGAVALAGDGGAAIWLTLGGVTGTSAIPGTNLAAEAARFWVILPAAPPRTHLQRNAAFAADLRHLTIPQSLPSFGYPIDDLAFGLTVMGPIPPGSPRAAAAAWSNDGGTIELDHFHLGWGGLGINASGTLALDQDLQPIGGFSGTVTGYDTLLAALVSAGRIRAGDARIARVALAMLAKAGPDGKPQIATSFTIQDGAMFLGPARLGALPRIPW